MAMAPAYQLVEFVQENGTICSPDFLFFMQIKIKVNNDNIQECSKVTSSERSPQTVSYKILR